MSTTPSPSGNHHKNSSSSSQHHPYAANVDTSEHPTKFKLSRHAWFDEVAFDHIPGELLRIIGLFAGYCHPILYAYLTHSKDYNWDDLRARVDDVLRQLREEAKEEKKNSWIYLIALPALLHFDKKLVLPTFSACVKYVGIKGLLGRWNQHLEKFVPMWEARYLQPRLTDLTMSRSCATRSCNGATSWSKKMALLRPLRRRSNLSLRCSFECDQLCVDRFGTRLENIQCSSNSVVATATFPCERSMRPDGSLIGAPVHRNL